jgi:hypothetical protein
MSESQSQTSHDFWPADLATIGAAITPVSILREQATILSDRTQGLVTGEVVSMPLAPGERSFLDFIVAAPKCEFRSRFLLLVPALDNYRYLLLEVLYPIDSSYPMVLEFSPTQERIMVASQQHFYSELKRLLSCEKTVSIIRSLIAQARS